MLNNVSLKEWIENYKKGEYDSADFVTQCKAGWHDWFCREKSLVVKTKQLAPKVIKIAKSYLINPEEVYIFFKNNCPMRGKLYDHFSICDLKTKDVLYCVIPKNGFTSNYGVSEVWGKDNDFSYPLVSGSWSDVLDFFNV